MPTARSGLSTAAVDSRIYAIGGWIGNSTTASTVEEYDLTPPPLDFNGDGNVDIKDLLRLIQSWGQADPVADIAPIPFGDGVVDAVDLERLMDYWGREVKDGSLEAHWRLDETEGIIASDSTGGHDATVMGAALWQPDGGCVDGALEFDGATFVVADFVLNPSSGPFSVFAWVKGGAPGQTILSQ